MNIINLHDFQVANNPDTARKMLTFEFSDVDFDLFHVITKSLPDNTQPTFTVNDNNDVLVDFSNELRLSFAAAGEGIHPDIPFLLIGGTRMDNEPEIVLSLIIRPKTG